MARPIARALLALAVVAAAGVAGAGVASATPADTDRVKLVSMREVAEQADTGALQAALASWERSSGHDSGDAGHRGGGRDTGSGADGVRGWFEQLVGKLFISGDGHGGGPCCRGAGDDDDVLDVDLLSKVIRDVGVDADVRDNVLAQLNDVLNDAEVLNDSEVNVVKDVATFEDVLNHNDIVKNVLNDNNVNVQDVIALGTSKDDTILVTK